MFLYATKAHIPIIAVTTDDILNYEAVIQTLSGKGVRVYPTSKTVVLSEDVVYITDDADQITPETYKRLVKSNAQLVAINLASKSSLVFDAGELPTPPKMIEDYLKEILGGQDLQSIAQALKGCSLKAASELVQLASVMFKEITPKAINATRLRVAGSTPGLFPLDTDIGYWMAPTAIKQWVALNKDYLSADTSKHLAPRGLMLAGPPGVGKSMAARAVAKELGIPAFRLDIATSLNRYIGESEARVAKALDTVSRSSPCLMLMDEVEKVFVQGEDSGTTTRLLSQLLWWLSEKKDTVVVVMTTNNLSVIPPELYRPGRIDRVIHLQPLGLAEARELALKVFELVVKKKPNLKQTSVIRECFQEASGSFAHSLVHEVVCDLIKINNWG